MDNHLTAASAAGLAGTAVWGAFSLPPVFAQDIPITNKLAEYGVSGVLISVIIYIVYLLLNKTLQGRETDLQWHREELARKAVLFQSMMDAQFKASTEKQQYIVDKLTTALEKIENKVAYRSDDIAKLMETMRNTNDCLEDVKSIVGGCHEVQQLRLRMVDKAKEKERL